MPPACLHPQFSRNQTSPILIISIQAWSSLKHSLARVSSNEHLLEPRVLARWKSTMASLQQEDSIADLQQSNGFKGHGVLPSFTVPRETNEVGPLVIQKSEGCYLFDIDGRKYLDMSAGAFCTALGGSEARLVEAAAKQFNTLPFYQCFSNKVHQPAVDLAKELLEAFTARKMAKVFLSNSGSDANDSQVKLAWFYNNALGRPKKKKVIAQEKAYHGTTIIAASLSGLPHFHESFDLPAPFVLRTDAPHYWRNHLPGETEEQFATRLANNLENLILKEGPETIAAFIAEPVMGYGGVIVPPATYFEKVQSILKKYDILFMVDEIASAFGRCGTMFACDKFNIKPDLVTLAKALSSGYAPISATLISPEFAEVISSYATAFGDFAHGFTYCAHPVASSVALEAVKIYKERKIHEHVQKISPRFLDGLKAFSDSPIIGEIRGTGLFAAVEFAQNKSPNETFPPEWGIGRYFESQCRNRGLLVREITDAIAFCPSLIITPEEVDKFLSIFGEALKATEDMVKELKMKHQEQRIKNLTFHNFD